MFQQHGSFRTLTVSLVAPLHAETYSIYPVSLRGWDWLFNLWGGETMVRRTVRRGRCHVVYYHDKVTLLFSDAP